MMQSTSSSDNPGTILASAVDAEVANFRDLQESLQKLRNDYQVILGQMTENEMVQDEMKLLNNDGDDDNDGDSAVIYKMIGPVLIRQTLDDAKQTVSKRLEFIQQERDKVMKNILAKEKSATELATKIQQMQSTLQETTVRAVQAITAQHNT
jgi:prefoldin beta subunit